MALGAPERLYSLVLSDTNPASAPGAKAAWAERMALVEKAGPTAPLAPSMMGRLLSPAFKQRGRFDATGIEVIGAERSVALKQLEAYSEVAREISKKANIHVE